jgi:Ion channel
LKQKSGGNPRGVVSATSTGAVALGAFGGLLVIVATVDVFLTVFNHDGFTFVASRFQTLLWRLLRLTTRPLPDRPRQHVLSIGSAAVLPATVAFWLALEIVGFALTFYPGFPRGGFATHAAGHSLGSALYLSAGAISSLSFGDIVPLGPLDRALVDVETIVGLSTFTLALGYVMTTFGVLSALDSLHGLVHRHAGNPERPSSIVARHFRGGSPSELPSFLQELGDALEEYDQGLRRYPVVYRFHTRRRDRSIPHIFAMLGSLLELLHFGLPRSEPVTQDAYLAALLEGYTHTVDRLRERFVGPDPIDLPDPRPERQFRSAYADGGDELVDAFKEVERSAREAAGHEDEDDADALYARYSEWLKFHCRQRIVLNRVADNLVYERPL